MAENQGAGGTSSHGEKNLRKRTGLLGSLDGHIHVSRPAYSAPHFWSSLGYAPRNKQTLLEGAKSRLRSCVKCSPGAVWALLLVRVPILSWLPRYKYKKDFIPDLITGLTVGIMHLPQGMGYAMLAEVPPIVGLYTAFFPVLSYVIFGTSRHISMGTFAVGCLMTGKIVVTYASPTPLTEAINATDSASIGNISEPFYSHVQVSTAAAFVVGVWQLIFAVLQLGKMSVFLPEMIISGFSTGVAVHVFSSQVKNIFGLKLQRHDGVFYLIYLYIDIVSSLTKSNPTTLIMSAISLTILGIYSEVFKPRVRKYTNIPIPVDLFAIIIGTAVTYSLHLDKTHGVIVVANVPTGLPAPIFPEHSLFIRLLFDCFILAVIIYVISFSLAKIFCKKHGYTINSTQELYAGGISNVFGSFFSIVPSCASLPRSMVQETVGGKTQIVSIVSCCVVLMVLLFVGPLFNTLPTCVLSSIIVVALKGLFMQVFDCVGMWKLSKGDAMLWITTFLTTVLVDVEYGLVAGVLLNLVLLLQRSNQPTVTTLGWIPKTDIYVDIDTYKSAVVIPGVCLCRVSGSLNSVTVDHLREQLMIATGIDTTLLIAAKAKREKKERREKKKAALHNPPTDEGVTSTPRDTTEVGVESTAGGSPSRRRDQIIVIENTSHNLRSQALKEELAKLFRRNSSNYACGAGQLADVDRRKVAQGNVNEAYHPDDGYVKYSDPKDQPLGLQKRFTHSSKGPLSSPQDVSFVVLCLSGVGCVDVSAAKDLGMLFTEHSNADISMALAGTNDAVMQVLRHCGVLDTIPEHRFYYSMHDAVTSLVAEVLDSKPQPSPFDWAKNGVEGPPPITQDVRSAVVPAVLRSHALRHESGVPVPTQLRASHLDNNGMEVAADDYEYYQAQRNFAQPSRHKKREDAKISRGKRAKDPQNNLNYPTSELILQPRSGEFNTRF